MGPDPPDRCDEMRRENGIVVWGGVGVGVWWPLLVVLGLPPFHLDIASLDAPLPLPPLLPPPPPPPSTSTCTSSSDSIVPSEATLRSAWIKGEPAS